MQALILLALGLLAGCHGYSYVIPASFRTPGICFYNGRILPKGNSQIPMVCQNTNCREDGSIMVDGCRRISLPGCTLIEHKSFMKSYPDCCEMTYECIDADGNIYIKQWNQREPTSSNGRKPEKQRQLEPANSNEGKPEKQRQLEPANSNGGKIEKQQKLDFQILSQFILQLLLFV